MSLASLRSPRSTVNRGDRSRWVSGVRDRNPEAFPGCGTPPERCDAHHVRHHHDGGATDIDNPIPRRRDDHVRRARGVAPLAAQQRSGPRSCPEDDHSLCMVGECAEILEIAGEHSAERLGECHDDGIDSRAPSCASAQRRGTPRDGLG